MFIGLNNTINENMLYNKNNDKNIGKEVTKCTIKKSGFFLFIKLINLKKLYKYNFYFIHPI